MRRKTENHGRLRIIRPPPHFVRIFAQRVIEGTFQPVSSWVFLSLEIFLMSAFVAQTPVRRSPEFRMVGAHCDVQLDVQPRDGRPDGIQARAQGGKNTIERVTFKTRLHQPRRKAGYVI